MQILNLATLLAVIGASSAFSNHHAKIARRQNVAGALGTSSTSSSSSSSITFSASASASFSSSSTASSTTSSSSSQVTTSSTTKTTSTNVQPTGTSTVQQTTTSVPGAATGTSSSTSSSIVLTGDATLSATGVPALASISSGMPTESTYTLTATYTPGATPIIKGAPPLPTFVFSAADWPALDKSPDVNSPEVQEWMKELDGYNIPDIATTDGTCGGSPQAAANAAQNGWWTCGHYTRSTDIVECPTKMTWGSTFDDGPSLWTPKLLNFLKAHNINTTFFAVGSRVVEYPSILVEEYMSGNEIAVHTWSHPAMTSQTNAQIVAELGWTRKAIQAVLGVTPVYWRPPYGDIDDRVRAIALAMGLVAVLWTTPPNGGLPFDTNDWMVAGGLVSSVSSYETFESILSNATTLNTGFAVLEHDLFEVTVDLAVGYFLPSALSHQPPLTIQPVLKCQGFPATDIYRETTTNKTFPYPNSTTSDINGSGQSNTTSGGGSSSGSSSGTFLHPPALIAGLATVLLSALW